MLEIVLWGIGLGLLCGFLAIQLANTIAHSDNRVVFYALVVPLLLAMLVALPLMVTLDVAGKVSNWFSTEMNKAHWEMQESVKRIEARKGA